MTLHEARQTFASVLIAAGLDPKQTATYRGHASVQVTFDVYGKLFPTSLRDAVMRVDRFLGLPSTLPTGSEAA